MIYFERNIDYNIMIEYEQDRSAVNLLNTFYRDQESSEIIICKRISLTKYNNLTKTLTRFKLIEYYNSLVVNLSSPKVKFDSLI